MTITQVSTQSADDIEEARLRAVERYAILDTPADEAFDRIARVAARCLGTPMATIAFVDAKRTWFKATHGVANLQEIERDRGPWSSVILDDAPCVVRDTVGDPRTSEDRFVVDDRDIRFYAGAPIITSDGHRIGVIDVLDTQPRNSTEDDIATLSDLAGVVMDELELRLSALTTVTAERELRDIAEHDKATIADYAGALQRSLLPPSLPHIPGLLVAAHYHPATSAQVGGDFYDVFALDKRRWAFFLGDVEGHGTAAASVTSLVRHTLRAAALHHEDPTDGLAELNTVLVGDPNEKKFCTVMFGMLAAEEGNGYHVRLATGGHLPALLLDPETGTVSEIRPEGGMFVGAVSDATFDQCTLRLRSGQSLLLYTDGITEARPDGADCFGEDALRAFLADRVALPADELIGELATLVPNLRPDDDIALLALSAQ
jgi:sigma-B regulation protein RsbU (phosphoserine phosphatase)